MTRAQVELSIQNNLASGSNIIASKHRQVENDILDYIDTQIGNVQSQNKLKFIGSVGVQIPGQPAGDVPVAGGSQVVQFPGGIVLPNTDYVVVATLGITPNSGGNLNQDTTVIFTISAKGLDQFSVTYHETDAYAQNLYLMYAVFQN
jgi:hypothetical protein